MPEDLVRVVHEGRTPDKLVCDTTLRRVPDGSWVLVFLGLGDWEPSPGNRVCMTRSTDQGRTWTAVTQLDLGMPAGEGPSATLSELMVLDGICWLFVSTHNGAFGNWKLWITRSADSCQTWSALEPAPEPLHRRCFIRNHIVTRDGRIVLPFQRYGTSDPDATRLEDGRFIQFPRDPRNGIMTSPDRGRTWTIQGAVRTSDDPDYCGWAESNIVELSDRRIVMLIRTGGVGVLSRAESADGGLIWPDRARLTDIPNPGSKITLYGLGGDRVAMLHNPNPKYRNPLALWVSEDGARTWPHRRVLVDTPGMLNYPDGFVSGDGRFLHFAFDDNRCAAVYVAAELPGP